MHKGDTVPGLTTVVFGLLFAIATLTGHNLNIGSTTSDGVPGAGFFPILLASVIVLLGVILLIKGIRQKGGVQYIRLNAETKKNMRILALTVAGLVVFFIFWQLTHLFIIGILLLNIYFNRIFERTWKFTLIYSASFAAFIYVVFSLGFSIQFGI